MNRAMSESTNRARTIIVLAKEPLPGRVKTRLQPDFTPAEAASLAAACLSDTLAAVRASPIRRRILAWEGDPDGWHDGFEVLPQPDGTLNDKLARAFADSFPANGDDLLRPTLLIGMDTPQVTPQLLNSDWGSSDAVIGLCDDGGFWAIGLRGVDPEAVFSGIEMSTDRTGAAQLARLVALGLSTRLLPPLSDVDRPADVEKISYQYPTLRIAHRYGEIISRRLRQPVDRIFDQVYRGIDGQSRPRLGPADRVADRVADQVAARANPLTLDTARWRDAATASDEMIVVRCESPVVDLGCGPGRMVRALQRSGRAALGIDISSVAVAESRLGGGLALRRRIDQRLPGEGRWGTALLLDGNIGIGGDVGRLLGRSRDLVTPGGLIICEVDQAPDRDDVHEVELSTADAISEPFGWAAVGARTVQRVAASLDMVVAEEWRADHRVFVTLRTGN